MKKAGTLLFVGGLALFAVMQTKEWFLGNLSGWLKKYLKIVGFQILNVTSNNLQVKLIVRIENATNFSLLLNSVNLKLYFNKKYVANLKSDINRELLSKSMTDVEAIFRVNYSELGSALWAQVISGSLQNWIIDLNGDVTVERITVPFSTYIVWDDLF